MGSTDATVRRRPPRRRLPALRVVVACAIPLLLVLSNPLTAAAPTGAPVLATLSVQDARIGSLPVGFWGADVRPYYALDASTQVLLNGTPITTLRWPGGATGDEYNYTANRLYYNDGSYYTPPTNESDFIAFCRSVGCRAILQLPGEIDQPATAAYYVDYTVHTLHFTPEYWEIGNEPALWTHFGVPWSNWTTTQSLNATPTSYAELVHAYIAAIRAVVPSASFVGLSGVGTGGYGEAGWIRETVAVNGPNLSAVAIHVYPAGGTDLGNNLTASSFLGTLSGNGALPHRVPSDRLAILAGCPSCGRIRLLVTELGSGTAGGPYERFMSGFPDMVYLAAEIAQAIPLGLPNVDVFAWQSTYNGSVLNANGSLSRTYGLYQTFFEQMPPVVITANLSGAPGGVYVAATRDTANSTYALLVVNANTTSGLQFSLPASGFPLSGSGSDWTWQSGTGAGPRSTSWTTPPRSWTVPSESVLLVVVG